jgi:hypothetical protein
VRVTEREPEARGADGRPDHPPQTLEEAGKYPKALDIVRTRVKPIREANNREAYRRYWWQFAEARREMRSALKGLKRYVAGVAQGKRLLLAWADAWTCPSNLTNVFAFDDDYAMGILSSSAHGAWAWNRSSTLKGDLRYTPSSAFETFPWPDPVSEDQRERIGELSRGIIGRRQQICAGRGFGLTALYNLVEEGGYEDLKALHAKLDEAVAEAYGWPRAVARDDDQMVRQLLELNREISAGKRRYDPFGVQASAMDELPLQDLPVECPSRPTSPSGSRRHRVLCNTALGPPAGRAGPHALHRRVHHC